MYLPWSDGTRYHYLIFWMLSFKPAFSLSSFTFIKRLFSSPSLSAIRVVSSAYLRLLIFLPAILIPACASSSLAFQMMYSIYKLNKQGDNIQPWHTPFSVWNQSVFPCLVLTGASWPSYKFLREQVRWFGISISLRIFQFVVIHTVKGFGVVNKTEADVFLELSCFFDDPADVGNLISGSSAFSKSSLNIWKFSVHILLKPHLEKMSITLQATEMMAIVQQFEHSLAFPFFGIGMKTDLFQSCGHCTVFQICWHVECSTLTALSFRIWNNSAGIISPPIALLIVMLPKAHLTSHTKMSGSR